MILLLALLCCRLEEEDKKEEKSPPLVAPVGTQWEGTFKSIEVSVSSTGRRSTKRVHSDVKIVIEERKGTQFTGAFWLDNGKKGFTIAGTIDSKGNIAFQFTKKLKGTWPSDMIANARVKGVIKKDELLARYGKGGNESVVGEIAAKVSKADD